MTTGFGVETDDTWQSSADPSAEQLIDPSLEPPPEPEPPPVAPAPAPEPMPVVPSAQARTGAGVAILIAGAGATAGWLLGGAWGAGAGLVFMGAARNGYRAKTQWTSADPTMRSEAAKSATMAALGAVLGGYLAYRAYQGRARSRRHSLTEVE